jgi:RNA polymerase sigma factor (sigma-70 family)
MRDRGVLVDMPDEEQLLAALAVDLDTGFADLVRVHQRLVYSVARRLTRRAEDAEDLAADALLRAYRALTGYDPARIRALRLRPWLLTVLRNTARNAARDASRRPQPPPEFEPTDEAATGPSVEELVVAGHTRREWNELLARLPDRQRIAVVLRHVEGLPISEVAEVLGCPEGTAKSHVSRGMTKLRALLADGHELPTTAPMSEEKV